MDERTVYPETIHLNLTWSVIWSFQYAEYEENVNVPALKIYAAVE